MDLGLVRDSPRALVWLQPDEGCMCVLLSVSIAVLHPPYGRAGPGPNAMGFSEEVVL